MKKLNSYAWLLTTALFVNFPAFAQEHIFSDLEKSANPNPLTYLSRIDSLTAEYYATRKITSFEAPSFPVNALSVGNTDGASIPVAESTAFLSTFDIPGTQYQERMNKLESAIPLEYNNYVRQFIDLYGVRKRGLTSRMLSSANYYFPIFEEILDRNNLPLEFRYLSIVESALNPNAVSHCGATGLWQFMYYTGKMYDLNINPSVDERKDLYKSTQAACDYFKQMYNIYGDWLLVIASYNCGPGNVNKAIRKSGGKTNFWQIMPYLPRETRGYVPAFIAVAYMMNYSGEHFIYPSAEVQEKPLLASIQVENNISFNQLATALDLTFDDIKAHNPTFKKGVVEVRSNQALYLPYAQAIRFIDMKDSIYRVTPVNTVAFLTPQKTAPARTVADSCAPAATDAPVKAASYQNRYLKHKVKAGEGLYTLAKKYHCSVQDLKRWNKLKSNTLHPGQRLVILVEEPVKMVSKPSPSSVVFKTDERTAEARKDSVLHTVKSGETLYSISRKYQGVTVQQLIKWNNITNQNTIKPGTVLKVNN